MQSKNKRPPNQAESRHIQRVKEMPCACCDEPGPSEAHEIEQGDWWTAVPLCESCHRGPVLGLHGQKRAWAVRKLTELGALSITIRRLMEGA